MRLVWTTDPHLNHVPNNERERWISELASHGADGVVISGDVSEGDDVVLQLSQLAQSLALPIFFVLGNHDFYQASIGQVRRDVIYASRDNPLLHYLTDESPIEIESDLFLVGEDGWCDATVGDYEGSTIRLNDFRLIQDFQNSDPSLWKQQLQDLGAESARRLGAKLDQLPDAAKEVVVVTHLPPFREACWYEGKTTDDNWAPFFVCGQVGQVMRRASQSRPSCNFIVLCGHTHNEGVAHISANLVVYTGAAQYGHPDIERIITTEAGKIVLRPAESNEDP